jgi:hypothetical protein
MPDAASFPIRNSVSIDVEDVLANPLADECDPSQITGFLTPTRQCYSVGVDALRREENSIVTGAQLNGLCRACRGRREPLNTPV